jgi:hypothetical protein
MQPGCSDIMSQDLSPSVGVVSHLLVLIIPIIVIVKIIVCPAF